MRGVTELTARSGCDAVRSPRTRVAPSALDDVVIHVERATAADLLAMTTLGTFEVADGVRRTVLGPGFKVRAPCRMLNDAETLLRVSSAMHSGGDHTAGPRVT